MDAHTVPHPARCADFFSGQCFQSVGREKMMNRSTSLRSEEARRQAHSATLKAKQAQSEMLKERAEVLAVEAKKIDNLRAQRLAKEAATREAEAIEAAIPKPVVPRKRRTTKAAKDAAGETASGDMDNQA